MQLHHVLSHDGQQLANFTVSPVRTADVDIATTPLPKSRPWNRKAVKLHLREIETPDMCRVQEGKFGCEIKPVYYLGQCKRADRAGKLAG